MDVREAIEFCRLSRTGQEEGSWPKRLRAPEKASRRRMFGSSKDGM